MQSRATREHGIHLQAVRHDLGREVRFDLARHRGGYPAIQRPTVLPADYLGLCHAESVMSLITRLKPSGGALVYRGFRLLCLAILATSFGFYIQRTVELWLIYELTGSAFHLGLTGLVRGIPVFVLSPFGGVLADRIDRRRFVILVQTCNGAVNAGLAFLAVTGLIEVWHIYFSAFMNASFNALGAPARNAMVPGLVPREILLNALSLTAMSRKMSQLTAPVLTGFLILWLGSGPTYALNGLVYFSAAFLVAAIHYVSDVSGVRASPFRSLMEGFGFVRREAAVWVFLSMELITVYIGSYRALLPIFVAALGAGAGGFGLLLSAAAGGAILGVAVIMSLGDLRYKGLGLHSGSSPMPSLSRCWRCRTGFCWQWPRCSCWASSRPCRWCSATPSSRPSLPTG